MKIDLAYVDKRHYKDRVYYFFRKRNLPKPVPLPGVPGTAEFMERYDELLRAHAPRVRTTVRQSRERAEKGTLAWVVERFIAPEASPWKSLSEGTREKYRLRFDWLREEYGHLLLSSFDRDMVKVIRNKLKNGVQIGNKVRGGPSIANETIDRIGQLWRWADENCDLSGDARLGDDPTRGVARVEVETESALAWTDEVCQAFETIDHPGMITFYFLARYTGQRLGDCCDMKWADFNPDTNEIFVVQEKTGSKVWIPCHPRLRAYLDGLPRGDEYILMSPRGDRYNKNSVSKSVGKYTAALGFPGYTPHGLRHAAAVAIIEAGGTVDEAMAITGHKTRSQLDGYLKEVGRRRLGHQAMAKWAAADADKAAVPASNVTPLRARIGR